MSGLLMRAMTAGHDEFRDMRSPYQFRGLKNPLRQAAYPISGVPVVVHLSVGTCAPFSAVVAEISWLVRPPPALPPVFCRSLPWQARPR